MGGRNINKRKLGGDWRLIKQGTMTKMKHFAFGEGTEQSPQDCMTFYVGTNSITPNVEKKLGGNICEIEIAKIRNKVRKSQNTF